MEWLRDVVNSNPASPPLIEQGQTDERFEH
jgi:hypothetical protein